MNSPDLVPSHHHRFGVTGKALRAKHYCNDDKSENCVVKN